MILNLKNDYNHIEVGPAEQIARFESCKNASVSFRSICEYGRALRLVGRGTDALKQCDRLELLAKSEFGIGRVSLFRGETFLEMKRFSEAGCEFLKACVHDPSTVPRIFLAVSLSEQEQFNEALAVLTDAIGREGDVDEVFLNIALNQRALGDLTGTLRSIEKALAITPDYPAAASLLEDHRDFGPLETIARFECKGEFPITNRDIFDYADALRKMGKRQEALKQYEELLGRVESESKIGLIELFRGETFHEMGRFTEAEQSFRKACACDRSAVPRIYLAKALTSQERFSEALDVLSGAVGRAGDLEEVLLKMALNQRALGNLSEALRSIEGALAINPDYPEARVVLEDVRAALQIKYPPGSSLQTP